MENKAVVIADTKAVLHGVGRLWAVLIGVVSMTYIVPTANAESAKKDFYCFVVDRSSSIATGKNQTTGKTRDLTETVREAISGFVGLLNKNTEVELVFFSVDADSPKRWDKVDLSNKSDFTAYVDKNYTKNKMGLQTRLYDTVAEAIERITPRAAEYDGLTILVITDGEDNKPEKYKNWEAVDPLIKELIRRNPKAIVKLDALGYVPANLPKGGLVQVSVFAEPEKKDGGYSLSAPSPNPEFECLPSTVQMNEQPVAFRLKSESYVKNVFWSFGDGLTSTNVKPSHVYSVEGMKTVEVIVTGLGGQILSNRVDGAVRVEKMVPLRADFDWLPTTPREGEKLVFRDKSLGVIESWTWTIKGVGTFPGRDPDVPQLKADDYETSLTVIGKDKKANTITKIIYVLPPVPLKAAFVVTPPEGVRGGSYVTFTDQSTGMPATWSWMINGQSFSTDQYPAALKVNKPGLSIITLKVAHKDGRTNVATNTVKVLPPLPDASFEVTPERLIVGKSASLVSVSPLDGEKHSWLDNGKLLPGDPAQAKVSWIPQSSGKHTLTHRVKNTHEEVVFPKDVYVEEPLEALFFIQTPRNGWLSGNTISFVDKSSGDIKQWYWSFGDGSTTNVQNPTHSYDVSISTNFSVTLTVSSPDGKRTISKPIAIDAGTPPSFEVDRKSGQLPLRGRPLTVKTKNLTKAGDHTFIWNFGDGGKSGEREPEHEYRAVGEYMISLVVRDNANGLLREAPPIKITIRPNTQIRGTLIWMGILAIIAAVGWIIWFVIRPPPLKKVYRLGTGRLDKDIIRIGADKSVFSCKHDISFPVAENFLGDFAELKRSPACPVDIGSSGELKSDKLRFADSSIWCCWGEQRRRNPVSRLVLSEGSLVEVDGFPYVLTGSKAGEEQLSLHSGWRLAAKTRGVGALDVTRDGIPSVAEDCGQDVSLIPGKDVIRFGGWSYAVERDTTGWLLKRAGSVSYAGVLVGGLITFLGVAMPAIILGFTLFKN
jgi:PKD repeat protein